MTMPSTIRVVLSPWRASKDCMSLIQSFPDSGAHNVHRNDDENSDERGTDCAEVAQVDPLYQEKANAAAADQADDGGRAHVDLPTINREGGEWRDDLRDDPVTHYLQPIAADGRHGFYWPWIDPLDYFGIQFGEGGDGVRSQGQHSCERPEADKHHKHHRNDQGFNGTQNIKQSPDCHINGKRERIRAHQVAGGEETDGDGQDGTEGGRHEGQGHCLIDADHHKATVDGK